VDAPSRPAPPNLVTLKRPRWNGQLRELRCGELLVKEFRRPAPNQELVLTAFEEEGWPTQIDDPLPGTAGVDPRQRLHDTIIRLNRNQRNHLVHFRGDGSGKGVRWEWVTSNGTTPPPDPHQIAS
jgi:hypothetical protein